MKKKNQKEASYTVITVFIITITFFFCFNSFPKAACALNGADIAIYNDSIAPYLVLNGVLTKTSGAWQDGVTAIKNMLTYMGFTYEEITYYDLNQSTQDFSGLYKVILMPGGFAKWYNYWINKSGKERIRSFVNKGGGYFGICAGAFFASDKTIWEGVSYDDNVDYNYYGELTGYDLDLFAGTGTGPMNAIADWNGEGYNMTTLNFATDNTVLTGYKQTPYTEDILYYGGPYFTADTGSNIEVLATYSYNGQPAIIALNYGYGRVVLSGPHPEIEEDSDRDGVTISREDVMDDKGSDWPLTKYMLNWLINSSVTHSFTPPSVTNVSRGGSLGPFYAAITNNTSSSYSFYMFSEIKTPDGNWYQLFNILVTLAVGETQ